MDGGSDLESLKIDDEDDEFIEGNDLLDKDSDFF